MTEKRTYKIWVCSECGEAVPSHYGPPMMPARGHYHDDPERPFGKHIFHPAEEIEVAPANEHPQVGGEAPRNWLKRLRDMDSLICHEVADWLEAAEQSHQALSQEQRVDREDLNDELRRIARILDNRGEEGLAEQLRSLVTEGGDR